MADPRTSIQREGLGTPTRYQICMPIAAMYKTPSPESMIDTQLVFGAAFDVYEIKDDWAYGQEIVENGYGYVGYIPMLALVLARFSATHIIASLRAPVFTKPDLKSPIRKYLPLNAGVSIEGQRGDYYFARDVGWLHQRHLIAQEDMHIDADFVEIAELHFGLPYVWGGVSSDGLDCSGLVQTSLRAVGRDAPRDADMQEATLGHSLPIRGDFSGLQRGDLIFWKGHVGIMGDAHMLLHANAHHMGVAIEPLAEAAERIAKAAGLITSIKRI
ncbi:MAG: peptidase P60 [Robiginitomaculum sp.]|nr:MAG: peptidase P60 [Robiginitomaculum sp.]